MKIKNKLNFRFTSKTIFMGKEYSKGNHQIDVSHVLGKVEYRSPDDMKLNIGLELHFREGLNAAAVSQDARTFLEGLRIKPTHQHIHITSKLPITQMQESPQYQAVVLTDFYARVNMAAEMFDIIYNKRAIKTRHHSKDESIVLFDHLKSTDLQSIQRYFEMIGRGQSARVGSRFKMAWVGLRGFDSYDGAHDLWGLEFRANLIDEPHEKKALLFDSAQNAMNNRRYGITTSAAEAWLSSMSTEKPSFSVADSYYNRELSDYPIHTKLSDRLTDENKLKVESLLHDWGAKHRELYMLIHDWSTSSILYQRKTVLSQILEQQQLYLEDLVSQRKLTSKEVSMAVGAFLKESNLFSYHLESLGIKDFPVD